MNYPIQINKTWILIVFLPILIGGLSFLGTYHDSLIVLKGISYVSIFWTIMLLLSFFAIPLIIKNKRILNMKILFVLTLRFFLALLLCVLIGSVAQVYFLENIDREIGHSYYENAQKNKIVGKRTSDIEQLFGKPLMYDITSASHYIVDRLGVTRKHKPFQWKYHQLPGYIFGSQFEVDFNDKGIVTYFEANDD